MTHEFRDHDRFAAALHEHHKARSAAHAGLNARNLGLWYRDGSHGLEPRVASHRAYQQAEAATRFGRAEHAALVALNDWCLGDGARVGDEVVLGGNAYRVVTDGNPAVHLGSEVPDSAPEAPDPAITVEGERREWASDYTDSIRTQA